MGKLGWSLGLRGALCVASVVVVPLACGTKQVDRKGQPRAGSGGVAGSGGSGGTAGNDAMKGPVIIVGGDDSGPIENTGLGGAGGEMTCAGEQHAAEVIPIDMYVMLDRSLSMNGKTSTGDTKWHAIIHALAAFASDPNSDGIGIGIQYFPANKPCTSNDDCPDSTCYLKACRSSRSGGSLMPCVRDKDCPASGDTCVELGGCGDQSCVSIGSTCANDVECTAMASSVCTSQTVCTLSDYATPEVPISALPAAKQDIIDSLNAYAPSPSPYGLTPTGPALLGAINYAQAWGAAHPTRKAIVVLATDGAPTGGCSPSRRAEIAALASVGAGATVPVQTYTIGVFSPADPNHPNADDTEGPDNIRAIAVAGKGQAFVLSDQGDVAAQFIEALNSVRGHGLACELQIPEADQGKEVDFGKVNVEFTPRAGDDAEIIPYLDDATACDKEGGWYYVADAKSKNPRRIVACEATCERLRGSVTGNVNIQVGCATIRRDPVK